MRKIFLFAVFSFLILETQSAWATSLSVSVCNTNGANCTFLPPNEVVTLSNNRNLSSIKFTVSNVVNMSINDTSAKRDTANWGIALSNTTGDKIYCTSHTTSASCSGVTVSYVGDPTQITWAGPSGATNATYTVSGNVTVNLDFSQTGSMPTNMSGILNSGGTIQAQLVFDTGNSADVNDPTYPGISKGPSASWKADSGALTMAASIGSVLAQDSAFVVNLVAPTDTSAVCPAVSASTVCISNNSTASATQLIATDANSVSGYLIAYWKDGKWDASSQTYDPSSETCNSAQWSFTANPISYNSNNTTPVYACTFNQNWDPILGLGGVSSDLGCGNNPPSSDFLTGAPGPNGTAIPTFNNFTTDLQTLIDNPGQEQMTTGCLKLVYVPARQSSWSKTGVENGDTYGMMVWALNSSWPQPTLSLAHSATSYITGTSFPLASLEKDPKLTKTSSDCFVVTAASGDVNSKAVFYWRILRDEYLTPAGITPFYYEHGKKWAAWLEEHPKLKPPLNFIFEKTGYSLYHLSEFFKTAKKKWITNLKNVWEQSAYAEESPLKADEPAGPLERNLTPTQSNNTTPQEKKPHIILPRYDISIFGGVLLPIADKSYYDKYYPANSLLQGGLGANYIFWWDSLGFSLGLQGRYLSTSQTADTEVLGSAKQDFSRSITTVMGEGVAGLRYRNPTWPMVQPGVYGAVGALHFRESGKANGASGNVPAQGVSETSVIYEVGANLDFNLTGMLGYSESSLGAGLSEVLLRLTGTYNQNNTRALSSTGYFIQGGFVFLLN